MNAEHPEPGFDEPPLPATGGHQAPEGNPPDGRQDRERGAPDGRLDSDEGAPGTGMGPTPSGPTFMPWNPTTEFRPSGLARAPLGAPPPLTPRLTDLSPPGSKVSALITAVVVLLVSAVVAVATLIANREDTAVSLPLPPSTAPHARVAEQQNSIEFSSSSGSGRLVVLNHAWMSTGVQPPLSGSYLEVQVELICLTGRIDYDPYDFQAFDAVGRLFDVAGAGSAGPLLDAGSLRPAQRVQGYLAFDMPRGDVTLLMSDDSAASVTALKIPD
jgi:hypothetical protein